MLSPLGIGIIIYVALFVSIGIAMGLLVKGSGKRYIVCGKSLPLLLVGTTLAAQSIDGNSTVGNSSLAYNFGFWSGFTIPLGLAVCLFVTGTFFARPPNRMNLLTLPGFYFRRYGTVTELTVSLTTYTFVPDTIAMTVFLPSSQASSWVSISILQHCCAQYSAILCSSPGGFWLGILIRSPSILTRRCSSMLFKIRISSLLRFTQTFPYSPSHSCSTILLIILSSLPYREKQLTALGPVIAQNDELCNQKSGLTKEAYLLKVSTAKLCHKC